MLLVHLVQNMGINNTQEFLDSYQLITYLSKIGQNFEFHNVSDVQRFMDYIYRLIHEENLNVVFFYKGFANFILEKRVYDSVDGFVPIDNQHHHVAGYFLVNDADSKDLIFGKKRKSTKRFFLPYLLFNPNLYPSNYFHRVQNVDEYYDIYLDNEESIDFSDLRFPKLELDKLFSQNNTITNSALLMPSAEQEIAKEANDKVLKTKSQNVVAKIINALIELAQLEIGEPYSYDKPNSANRLIYDILIKQNFKISQQSIGYWLELAKQQSPDK